MGGRLALFLLAAMTYPVSAWLAVGLLAMSLPLPWMAVVIANDVLARRTELLTPPPRRPPPRISASSMTCAGFSGTQRGDGAQSSPSARTGGSAPRRAGGKGWGHGVDDHPPRGRPRSTGSLGSPTVHRLHDRSKTIVRGHVSPRETVPLHPKTAAFGAHSRFVIDVLAAARPGLTHASRRRADLLHVSVGGRVCLLGGASRLARAEVGGVPVPPVVRRGGLLEGPWCWAVSCNRSASEATSIVSPPIPDQAAES